MATIPPPPAGEGWEGELSPRRSAAAGGRLPPSSLPPQAGGESWNAPKLFIRSSRRARVAPIRAFPHDSSGRGGRRERRPRAAECIAQTQKAQQLTAACRHPRQSLVEDVVFRK